METIQIDILNPKAKKLLKDLADLNLIKIQRTKKTDLSKVLSSLRSEDDNELDIDMITKEVEDVRASRYGK